MFVVVMDQLSQVEIECIDKNIVIIKTAESIVSLAKKKKMRHIQPKGEVSPDISITL